MKAKIIVLAVALLMIVSAGPFLGPSSTHFKSIHESSQLQSNSSLASWSSVGHDNNNTMRANWSLDVPKPTRKWSKNLSVSSEAFGAEVRTDSSGNIYVSFSDTDQILSYTKTGDLRWTANDTASDSIEHIVVGDDNLYGLDYGIAIHAYNLSDGTEQWSNSSGTPSSPLKYEKGYIYYGNWNEEMVKFNTSDLSVSWKCSMQGGLNQKIYAPATITQSYVYAINDTDSNLFKIDKSTGSEVWNKSIGGDPSNGATYWKGEIYVSTQNTLYNFKSDGTQDWAQSIIPSSLNGWCVYDNEIVLAGDNITAYSINDGTISWDVDVNTTSAPRTTSKGRILVSEDGHNITMIKNGNILWRHILFGQDVLYSAVWQPIYGSGKPRFYASMTNFTNNNGTLIAYDNEEPYVTPTYPFDGAENISTSTEVIADVGDNNTDNVTVEFINHSSSNIFATKNVNLGESSTKVDAYWDNLTFGRTYQWKVRVTDNYTSVTSEVMTFNTTLSKSYQWPMHGYDDSKTYHSKNPINTDGTILWNITNDAEIGDYYNPSSPVIDKNNNIYYIVGPDVSLLDHKGTISSPNLIISLYPNGTIRWYDTVSSGVYYSPTLLDDNRVAGVSDGTIKCWNLTGSVLWENSRKNSVQTPPIRTPNENILVGTSNNALMFGPDGHLKYSTSVDIDCDAVSINSTEYFYAHNKSNLFKFYLSNGTEVWNTTLLSSSESDISITSTGKIAVGCGNTTAVYYPNGTEYWNVSYGDNHYVAVNDGISVDNSDNIYFNVYNDALDNVTIYSFQENGTKRWQKLYSHTTTEETLMVSSITLGSSNKLSFSVENNIYTRTKDNSSGWSKSFNQRPTTDLVLDSKGYIIFGTLNRLYRLGEGFRVVTHSPLNDDVKPTEPIKVKFNRAVNVSSLKENFEYGNATGLTIDDVDFTWKSSLNIAVFDPHKDFKEQASYQVLIRHETTSPDGMHLDGDDDGIEGGDHHWVFTTGDFTPPTVNISVNPDKDEANIETNITLEFSEDMNKSSVENATSIEMGDINGWTRLWFAEDNLPSYAFIWSSNSTLIIDFSRDLLPLTRYTITVNTTAKDLSGNTLDGNKNGKSESSPTDDASLEFKTEWRIPEYIILAFVIALLVGAVAWFWNTVKNPENEKMNIIRLNKRGGK